MRKLIAVAAALMMSAASAAAATWPTKSVRVVVPFAPGGSADVISRLVMDSLSKEFGQQFYTDNRPGGGGIVAAQVVAHAAPDGYTLMQSGISSFVIAPVMSANPGFDPIKDFSQVAFIGGAPSVIVVQSSLGVKSFKDLIAYTKAAPGGLEYASAGVGTVGNLIIEHIADKDKVKFTHVPYKAGAGALLDLIAGRVKMGSMNWSTARAHIKSGKLVPLAVSSSQRMPEMPDLPTLAELGYPELATTTWQAIAAPKGVPADVVDRLNKAIIKALDGAQVKRQFENDGAETKPMTPQEMTAFMRDNIATWTPIIKASMKAN
ncbi:MAG TPA: tripartite tricarboxylate transporter substrate binding protein [Xanthobacteraceae bacterium]|jgi:tripartite-type tricarboxylate transporter receptor subunit TctC|nr:tripartite tricarboxylate transporter substrate binding protein [Xanthobacteraceae bacterium]